MNSPSPIPITDVPLGCHICGFYETSEELANTLVPYFAAGLQHDEFCVWVTADPLNVETAKAELRKTVPSIDQYIENGQMEISDYRDVYLDDGSFDGERVLARWFSKENIALERGYRGMRVSGDMSWLDEKTWASCMDYEDRVNRQICQRSVIGLCTYNTNRCRGNEVMELVGRHHSTLVRIGEEWTMVESHSHGMHTPLSSQIQQLSAHIVQRQDEARRRIAHRLLEAMAQDLVAISINLSGLQPLADVPNAQSALTDCRTLCEQNIQAIRTLAHALHPPLLDRFGLAYAVDSYIQGFSKQHGVMVVLEVMPGMRRLPLNVETNLFRIVEETLANVVRHSRSSETTVRLIQQNDSMIIEIEDFGSGLPAPVIVAISSGTGDAGIAVLGMRERMRQLGGTFDLRSNSQGTILAAKVPF